MLSIDDGRLVLVRFVEMHSGSPETGRAWWCS